MKQYLSPAQTAKLIELGFEKPKMAAPALKWVDDEPTFEPQYTIGELIEMLPENVAKQDKIPSTLNISLMNGEWCVQYADFLGTYFEFCNTGLIEALYDMIIKLKENGVI